MTIVRVPLVLGDLARCADITIGLVGLVERLANERTASAPDTLPARNLQQAVQHLSSAYAALNATAMLDQLAAHDRAAADARVAPTAGKPH